MVGLATEDSGGGSFTSVSEDEGGNVSDNTWHHVVAVRQGVNTHVYIDGVRVDGATAPAVKNVSNNAPFKIGAQKGTGGFNNWYNGLMDDIIVYNRALSADEINELFGL